MAEASPETDAAGAPPLPPLTRAGRERGVQLIGAGLVALALAMVVLAVTYDGGFWEFQAALYGPVALCLGVTWIVVGRVSPITCLWGLVGRALTSLTVYLVALKYVGV